MTPTGGRPVRRNAASATARLRKRRVSDLGTHFCRATPSATTGRDGPNCRPRNVANVLACSLINDVDKSSFLLPLSSRPMVASDLQRPRTPTFNAPATSMPGRTGNIP
jgi:hypothetical protein